MTPSPGLIRRYPWPYEAAFSFSNDCDYLVLDAMLALHRYLEAPTDEGGIGLEVSDSFFMYQHGSVYPNFSYFKGVSSTETEAAPVIRALINSGHLDTFHSFGDFEAGGCRRELAERVRGTLAKHGLRVPIWSNHGGFGNRHNIGRLEGHYYHGGDDFFGPFYILDVLEDVGVKYVWTDTSKSKRLALSPGGSVVPERRRKAPRVKFLWPVRTINRGQPPSWNYETTDVFESVKTRSGAELQGFIRYDGFFPDGDSKAEPERLILPSGRRAGPNIGRLAMALNEPLLEDLVSKEGCCLMYQHFSTLAHVPERTHITRELEFHPENVAALRLLASYQQRGLIWVTSPAILLDYLYMLNTSEASVTYRNGCAFVRVRPRKGFEFRGLAGLTVEVAKGTTDAVVIGPDKISRSAAIVGPDRDGRTWASLSRRRLERVDWSSLAAEHGIDIGSTVRITPLDGSGPVSLQLPGR